ncbi:MAG: hypothetical protein JO110_06400 [Acetobacteraceae bacterium]|nr:hypothetical protein [Acetobacteraceae bacterium]
MQQQQFNHPHQQQPGGILDETLAATAHAQAQQPNGAATPVRLLHARFGGRSHDIPLSVLDLGDQSADAQVIAALANHLDVPREKFAAYAVDRSPNGNFTVRPEAVFG